MKIFSKSFLKKLFVSGMVTFVLLIIAEIILSWLQIFPSDYYTNTPNSGFTWEINPEDIIGIHQDSEISFDDLGARSISNHEDATHKIVAFGGSTTACFALTQEKMWTAHLERNLGDSYWVGNFGRPGNNSVHHVLQFEHILKKPELQDVEAVLIMQGVNDFVAHLISPESYIEYPQASLNRIAFQHMPDDEHLPFYKRLTLYKLLARAKNNMMYYIKYKGHINQAVTSIKDIKKQVPTVTELPDLTSGLDHYEKNILNLIAQARAKNIQLIFTTQATMWKPDLEPKYQDLMITSGFLNNTSFYSVPALYKGMKAFNERLKAVCKRENVPCIELDLPKTTESFYDDFHFNESGAALTGKQLSQSLKTLLKK
ncbi:SGNH/GDSL hydrolase family protein [Kordia sp.]|uniref:SGNH/GDSL hydrolase family protein n=1 Tax=Kordia sp. TaxID=1965332 RepID=UPI003D29D7E2